MASVRVQGNQEQAINRGFRSVAGYIFGGNTSSQSIAMTAPVTAESETISMTTPVTAEMEDNGYIVSFMMPHEYTLDELPIPNQKDVQLKEQPATVRAVRTFSGYAATQRTRQELKLFQQALTQADIQTTGNFTLAQYNDPWTPGWMRRNEWWIQID